MVNLRKHARGKPCLVRLPCCNGDPETTVLAHLRVANIAGMGQKPPDTVATWACSDCHNAFDGRVNHNYERDWLNLQALLGMARYHAALHAEGFRMVRR